MTKFIKKPIVIEAWRASMLLSRITHKWAELPQQIKEAFERGDIVFGNGFILANTHDGFRRAELDDMVVCGAKGELYPCKPEIFFLDYDLEQS